VFYFKIAYTRNHSGGVVSAHRVALHRQADQLIQFIR
jgi:hypothetical protein